VEVVKEIDLVDLLKLAATSREAFAAYLVLGAGVLAYAFFKNASDGVKLIVFFSFATLSVGLFISAFFVAKNTALAVPAPVATAPPSPSPPLAPSSRPDPSPAPGKSACRQVQRTTGSGFNIQFQVVEICE